MNETIRPLINFKKFNNYISDIENKISPIMLSGLTDTAKIHLSYATSFYTKKPICIITYNEIQAKNILKDLSYFTDKAVYFPKKEIVTYDYIAESKDLIFERIDALNKIYKKQAEVIVTTVEAVLQNMIKKEVLYNNLIRLEVGKIYDLEELKQNLIQLGYERYDLVEGRGQFSIRGGIVDIAISNNQGIRVEFWGDEIDSIRYFNIQTQRSDEMTQKETIYPSHEYVLEQDVQTTIRNILEENYTEEQKKIVEEDIDKIKNGNYLTKIDRYFHSFYNEPSNILEYLNEKYIIVLDEITKIKSRIDSIKKDNKNIITTLVEKQKIVPDIIKNLSEYEDLMEHINNYQTIYLEKQDLRFIDSKNMHAKRNGYSFSYREVNFFRSSMDICLQEIQKAVKDKKTVIVLGGSDSNCKKISELLFNKNIINEYNKKESTAKNAVIISKGTLNSGFESQDFNLLVISTEEFFKQERKRRRASSVFKEGQKVIFSDLEQGDYVVHRIHGIGQYIGVNTITADNVTKDYIKIKYRDDDILYIPTNQLDSIRKYIGTGEHVPKLNRLRK